MPSVFKRTRKPGAPDQQDQQVLAPVEELAAPRKPYGFKDAVVGHHGLVYTPSGVYARQDELPLSSPVSGLRDSQDHVHETMGGTASADEDEGDDQASKKERQWRKWSEDIIPALIKPYLALLAESDGLRDMTKVRGKILCQGCEAGRLLDVSCIFFERIEKLVVCTCTEPALQLLSLGLFPCAPKEPTLAVDLNVLDFARELFVNAAPNTTAWCETLEGFLSSRKFKLTTRNTLRIRFGNALHWYATLVNKKNLMVRDYLNLIRGSVLSMDDDSHGDQGNEQHHPQHIPEIASMGPDGSDIRNSEPLDRPSEYLRERCPLCFGGQNWKKDSDLVDAIVCIDACFTQKRRKSQGNAWQAPNIHPETVFVPPDELDSMEKIVEELRPSKGSKKPRQKKPDPKNKEDADGDRPDYEPNMRVPASVLDECNDSFIAADDRRIKASTVFFADTGLMGLLCRHDRVLWLANMTSAGEKQYYALALLRKLFDHIPLTMRIGVLYDIGCQLHRSCEKFGFLKDVLDRIVFGISVFHAYGHQWPCQLIYHPRKCIGFGLTDGEGCERFWSLIKSLIPSCRVSSHFNRIYTIDTKVKHLDQKSLQGLGSWLQRKWFMTVEKKNEASAFLQTLQAKGYSQDLLRKEWDKQVTEQTKPLTRQFKTIANKAIEEIVALTKTVANSKKELTNLTNMLHSGEYEEGLTAEDIAADIEEMEKRIKASTKSINAKKAKLSVDGRLNLTRLLGNEFLQKRMNALALKQRIRDRLRHRKFEIEALERAYRSTMNNPNQAKLQKQSDQKVKKKEPGIQTLARNYNKLCAEMKDLISKKANVPKGAIPPLPIEIDQLFQLDVDDNIWLDIGLTDDGDASEVPQWLGNEDVREGIKAVLQYDRCVEEERRIKAEKLSMQQWMQEEWNVISAALQDAADEKEILFQITERKNYLLMLCVAWEPAVRLIPFTISDNWGPTAKELRDARKFEYTESVVKPEDLLDEGEWNDQEDDIAQTDLFDAMA